MNNCIFSLLFLAAISSACNRALNLEEQIQQWITTHNRHDVTKELTYYPEDAVISIGEGNPVVGKEALRDVFEYDSVVNDELVMKDFIIRNDTMIINSIKERWDYIRLAGTPEIHYVPGTIMIFRNGLIHTTLVSQWIPEDQKAFDIFFSGMIEWMRVQHADITQDFIGSMNLHNHNVKSAQMWKKLLNEYQATISGEKK